MPRTSDASARPSYTYNPYEVFVCDPAGEDGHALLFGLANTMAENWLAATVNDMTLEHRVATDGEPVHLLNTATQEVLALPRGFQGARIEVPLLAADVVLAMTRKAVPRPTIQIVGDGIPERNEHVIAYVADPRACPVLDAGASFFSTAQVDALARHVERYFREQASAVPVYGLVLAGGNSTRMGRDKGALQYDGRAQTERCLEMLTDVCSNSFVSVRAGQIESEPYRNLPCIADRLDGFGPMGGVLTAMLAAPHAAWIVLACDMPNLDVELLRELLANRNPFRTATCYMGTDGLPEPMCAVYEPKCMRFLFDRVARGELSLRAFLASHRVTTIDAPPDRLLRVNTRAEYEAYHSREVKAL